MLFVTLVSVALLSQQYQYAKTRDVRPGREVCLHNDLGGRVPVASGIFAYQDLAKYMAARDAEGINQLVADGEVAMLGGDTAARVIEMKDFVNPVCYEVRLLSGPHSGETVWVPSRYFFDRRLAPAAAPKAIGTRSAAVIERDPAMKAPEVRQQDRAEMIADARREVEEINAARESNRGAIRGGGKTDAEAERLSSGFLSRELAEANARLDRLEAGMALDTRAQTTLQMGRNVEGRNPSAALDYYRRVVRDWPDTAESKEAARRIETLSPPKAPE